MLASTSIWADITQNVACDGLAQVSSLIPAGGDPHSFEPSLRDREAIEQATFVVTNGLLLEESLEDTIDSAAESGVTVFRAGDHIEPIEFAGAEEEHADEGEQAAEAEHADEHDGADPHIWFDPTRVSAVLDPLAAALVAEVGLDEAAVDACVTAYKGELAALDTEIQETLAGIAPAQRMLVTNHEALGYFADRYDFTLLGAVIPSPSTLSQTSLADLEDLAATIEEAGVPAIFAESQHSSADADALAAQVGDVEVVTLFTDSLGEEGSGAESYLGLMRTDAGLIATALGG